MLVESVDPCAAGILLIRLKARVKPNKMTTKLIKYFQVDV